MINISEWSKNKVDGEYEYWQMNFLRNENNCVLPEFNHKIKISFENTRTRGNNGEYYWLKQEIKLASNDIDTISHESYHAVSHAIRKYSLEKDEEYGAYMVGSLVKCITDMIEA